MTSFPNVPLQEMGFHPVAKSGISVFSISKSKVNSLMAADDLGKPWLSVKNFLVETKLH